jgi:hypothetical protein
MLVSSLFPMVACAAPAPTPCGLMDRETLAALNLGDANTKLEHKAGADICTITPRVGASPSLSVMVIALPPGSRPANPVCNGKTEGKVGMAYCSAVVKDRIVTVSLVSPAATFGTLHAALRSGFDRLVTAP